MQFFICFIIALFGQLSAEDYPRNPFVEEKVWNSLKPYFLPPSTSIKPKLDALFRGKRPTASLDTLIQAGFQLTPVQGIRVRVLKHPDMPGYVFKVLTDDQDSRPDFESWLNRVQGAELIHKAIIKVKAEKYFFVPEKWIYPMPASPGPLHVREGGRKNFILIAKNVHPLSREKNIKQWNKLNDKKVLDALRAILLQTGAADSTKENNIPWCTNGKIAFLDTEHHHDVKNIRFARLEKVLNKKMKKYWIKIQGPSKIL